MTDEEFVDKLPDNDCRFAVYDYQASTMAPESLGFRVSVTKFRVILRSRDPNDASLTILLSLSLSRSPTARAAFSTSWSSSAGAPYLLLCQCLLGTCYRETVPGPCWKHAASCRALQLLGQFRRLMAAQTLKPSTASFRTCKRRLHLRTMPECELEPSIVNPLLLRCAWRPLQVARDRKNQEQDDVRAAFHHFLNTFLPRC